MPARDAIHEAVRNALVKDGSTITDDPYIIAYDDLMLLADLAAERTLAAERNGEKAVIEAKSFSSGSETREFETALGQYLIYRVLAAEIESGRRVYLAIASSVFDNFFARPAIQLIIRECRVTLVVVDLDSEELVQWHRPESIRLS
jgi:hypothetical protein